MIHSFAEIYIVADVDATLAVAVWAGFLLPDASSEKESSLLSNSGDLSPSTLRCVAHGSIERQSDSDAPVVRNTAGPDEPGDQP